ncbi:response regulator transcription factor [Vibrio sp. DW001]|uniref:response regulator transcription factor n=1 Tax=unclassified Vibrio TaxID=2614977 RepID=UPI00189E194C|nr:MULTISPECIES: response regulator transcription factor [unclassified Vibrio]UGA56557.1 response regulator transcription factor [Vibrio sp. VB16]WED29798.1 response regulator transcription factor [Vibrio sp. DW001]
MLNLLLVEDDIDLATAVIDYLELEGIQCDHAANGVIGLNLIERNDYHAIILDLNLPLMHGLAVCESMRSKGIDTPVLMLTAMDSLDDKLAGFAKGTDDYLIKPFAMEELIVRARTLARRRSGQATLLSVAGIKLDVEKKTVYREGRELKLSPTAIKILELLLRNSPNPVSRTTITQVIWGDEQPESNSLKVHIFNLRKQLNSAGDNTLIHTIPGFGFSIEETEK